MEKSTTDILVYHQVFKGNETVTQFSKEGYMTVIQQVTIAASCINKFTSSEKACCALIGTTKKDEKITLAVLNRYTVQQTISVEVGSFASMGVEWHNFDAGVLETYGVRVLEADEDEELEEKITQLAGDYQEPKRVKAEVIPSKESKSSSSDSSSSDNSSSSDSSSSDSSSSDSSSSDDSSSESEKEKPFNKKIKEGSRKRDNDRRGGDRKGNDRRGGDRHSGDRRGGDRHGGDRRGGDRRGGDRNGGDRRGGDRNGGFRSFNRDNNGGGKMNCYNCSYIASDKSELLKHKKSAHPFNKQR